VLTTSSKHRSTLDTISKLDRDTFTALKTIREWRNSLVPINRLPLEVLSLIPTYLSHDVDLFRATSVCRHWRRTFIQHAALWSRLNLKINKSSLFVKTLLERAKGSALDITSVRLFRTGTFDILALLSPHTRQIRSLDFDYDYWPNIQRFSEAVSGPLPLLHTLQIHVVEFDKDIMEADPPSLPLFSGAVNLEKFILHSEGAPYLNHFAFPNLTTFELTTSPEEFPTSQLLDFLEASPTLRTVCMKIGMGTHIGYVPPERVVVLPNIDMFAVTQDDPGYGIATRISCPSARFTLLLHEQDSEDMMPQEVFSVPWGAIGPQYMASTIDEVVLAIKTAAETTLSCSLSFSSPGPTTLELGYRMIQGYDETPLSLGEEHSQVFSQASKAVREHPHLSNIKRLRIRDRHDFLALDQLARIAEEAARLFKFVGPLEELILDVDDLRPFLSPFSSLPEFQDLMQPDAFPPINELAVERSREPLEEECMAAIVKLVKSQHALGVPFKRVVFRMKDPPVVMVERLKPWVGTLHFDEMIEEDDEDFM